MEEGALYRRGGGEHHDGGVWANPMHIPLMPKE